MEWLTDNWYWVVGAILLFIILWRATRPRKKPVGTQSRSRPATTSYGRTQTKEEAVAALVAVLTDALESVVDDTVGRHFSKADRRKIALGMIAVMTAENIPLDRLTKDPELFATVMLKSIATLGEAGHISVR